jgi:DNA-binding XRE family transcriptional regulator
LIFCCSVIAAATPDARGEKQKGSLKNTPFPVPFPKTFPLLPARELAGPWLFPLENGLPPLTPCGISTQHFFRMRQDMGRETFSHLRVKLGKTQKELARLLGVSLKAVQSYEQGWRAVPIHIERQLYFLAVSQRGDGRNKRKDCWVLKKCVHKKDCPAWEFQAGHLCWFLNGTRCECTIDKKWREKMEICRNCEVLTSLL